MNIIFAYAISIVYFVLILLLSHFSKNKLGAPEELARKIVHICISVTWLIWAEMVWGTIHFILMPFIGLLIAIVGVKTGTLKMIDRGATGDREGIIYYMITELTLAILSYFYHPALIASTYGFFSIAFGDGMAALIGKEFGKYTPKICEGKSLAGSLGCFVFAALAMIAMSIVLGHAFCLWKIAILALVATIVEIYAGKMDNLLIGWSVALLGLLLRV